MADKTSFVQFEYCPLCKTSHKKKKKHLYSKRHKEMLQNILRKFLNKIQTAKATLLNPEIQPLKFEMGAKFWCYFCAKEVEKHTRKEFCIIQYGGLLCHIASDEHLEKLLQFFWDNIVERSLKSKYILLANELEIFKKTSFLAVKKYEKSLEIKRKQMAEQIHSVEQKRHQLMIQSMQEKSETSLTRLNSRMLPLKGISTRQKPAGKKTISAYGEGLAWIQNKCFDEDKGNIFTEATPPWLCVDEEDGNKQTWSVRRRNVSLPLELVLSLITKQKLLHNGCLHLVESGTKGERETTAIQGRIVTGYSGRSPAQQGPPTSSYQPASSQANYPGQQPGTPGRPGYTQQQQGRCY